MRFYEFKTIKTLKPLNSTQARIKSLKDQAKRAQAAVKAERARQKIHSAQQYLNQLEDVQHPKVPYKALHKVANAKADQTSLRSRESAYKLDRR